MGQTPPKTYGCEHATGCPERQRPEPETGKGDVAGPLGPRCASRAASRTWLGRARAAAARMQPGRVPRCNGVAVRLARRGTLRGAGERAGPDATMHGHALAVTGAYERKVRARRTDCGHRAPTAGANVGIKAARCCAWVYTPAVTASALNDLLEACGSLY